MIDFEKINVHDLVKCYSVEGCPSGYVFNGIVLAKNVKVDNMVNENGDVSVGIVDCIVINYRDSKEFFDTVDFDFEKFGVDFDYRMKIIEQSMDFGDGFYFLNKNDILDCINKNDIENMENNIKIFDNLQDNVVVELINDDKKIFLKKDNKKLFVSTNCKDWEKSYYTIFYYINVGTKMKIL